MKAAALVPMLVITVAPCIFGSPLCASGTLTSYEALGSGGCTIGSSTLFGFNTPPGLSSSYPIPPADIIISPTSGTNTLSLTFSLSTIAINNAVLEALINYSISGPLYALSSISASGTSSSGNGGVTDIQNFCAGGSFDLSGVRNCNTGNTGDLLILGDGNVSSSFPAVALLSLTDDFTLDSGDFGSANMAGAAAFTDQLTFAAASVPEPQTLFLALARIFSAAVVRRLRH
jgi:hypothetical protein